jgi:hypothetical protein
MIMPISRRTFTQEDLERIAPVDQTIVRLLAARVKSGLEADVHCITASYRQEVPLDEVTPKQRDTYKQLSFGVLYDSRNEDLWKPMRENDPRAKIPKDVLEKAIRLRILPKGKTNDDRPGAD